MAKMEERGWAQVPPVVFWNLRATGSAPAPSDAPGVISMSGFSQKLVAAFLKGEDIASILSKTAAEKLAEVLMSEA